MHAQIEVLQPFIGVQGCPIEKMHCIADWQTPCPHFRGMMLMSGGYYGVVCTALIDKEDDSGSTDVIRKEEGLWVPEEGAVPYGPSDG